MCLPPPVVPHQRMGNHPTRQPLLPPRTPRHRNRTPPQEPDLERTPSPQPSPSRNRITPPGENSVPRSEPASTSSASGSSFPELVEGNRSCNPFASTGSASVPFPTGVPTFPELVEGDRPEPFARFDGLSERFDLSERARSQRAAST